MTLRPVARLRLAADGGTDPLADSGPDSMTRQAGVAGAGPGSGPECGPGAATGPAADLTVRILATTDLHANILSYDYAAHRPLFGQGLAQTASLISAARAEVPDAFLFDNGDFLQGSALADLAARGRRKKPHPAIQAFNALRYDAVTLGNHEFNFGLDLLQRAIEDARFPVVSANVLRRRADHPLGDDTLAPPFALVDRQLTGPDGRRHRLRLGVLGLTPPEILRWDREHLGNRLYTRPMVEAARAWVPEMRRAGADLVLCLAHTGIGLPGGGVDADGQATEIAEIDGIDLLIAGHSHLVFPFRGLHPDPRVNPAEGRLAGKPAVQPGHSGSHLGIMDLSLRVEAGRWQLRQAQVRAVSVSEEIAGMPADTIRRNAAALRRAVGSDHRAALAWTRKAIGTTEIALSTCLAQVADVPAMRLVACAKTDYVRRALAGTPHAGLPIVTTATPYRAGGRGGPLNYTDIAAGDLTVRNLFDLYPFPNTAVAVLASGAEIVEQIERAAALYLTIIPGAQNQPLIDPSYPSHSFSAFHGLSYRIDPAVPPRYDQRGTLIRPGARRVVSVTLGGRPVHPDDRFVLVTNNYRTGGTLGIPAPRPTEVVLEDRMLMTDVLRGYLQRARRIDLATCDLPETWALAPHPGTTVTFDSGPCALAHLSEAARLAPEFLGITDTGFHRLRLHL